MAVLGCLTVGKTREVIESLRFDPIYATSCKAVKTDNNRIKGIIHETESDLEKVRDTC